MLVLTKGGCFETSELTSHEKPVFEKYDVVHYCVPNIPSRVSRTASYAISNILTPILIRVGDEGGFESLLRKDVGLRQGVYVCRGMLSNKMVGEWFGLPFQEIELIMDF